ncbi:26S proteasome complex subunit [Saxophila tyrrhenica]|uniref:26S proteasome complex subunit SEM1 n=1 Tax=Saxophila tyrrhenica TaxID=1690608 RepID=A0AAV9P5S8_9PEZI|nr:26S proteasome complex subunit [Saxophila tyrrhenica]
MSGASTGQQDTRKAVVSDSKDDSKPLQPQKNAAQLEEDDEFEDFPVEDWAKEEETGAQQSGTSTTTHLWEESWDDDDTTDDFSVQLKEELKKMEGQRK